MSTLHLLEFTPDHHRLLDRLLRATRRHPWGALVGTARLVDKSRQGSGQLRGVEIAPHSAPQRLGRDQVELGVEAFEVVALLRDAKRAGLVTASEIAQLQEHVADPVEGARNGVGALFHASFERARVSIQLEPTLGPSSVVFPVGTAVTRMLGDRAPQLGHLSRRAVVA